MRRRRISRSVLSCRTLLTDRHKRSPGAVSFASTHRKRVDGSAAEVPIWSGAGLILINDWSGDGQYLLLTLFDTSNPGIEVWLLPNLSSPSVTRGPVRFDTGGRGIGHVQFVPSQGPPLGITTDGVVVRGMPGTKPGPWQIGSENARLPRWRRDGRELFFHDDGYLQVVERAGSTTDFKFGPPRRLFPRPFGFQIAGGQWAPECLRQGALSFASPCDAGAHRAESEQCKCARLGNSLRFRIEEIIHRHNVHSTSRIVIRPER